MVGFMLPFSIYGYIQVTSSDPSALEIIQTSKGHGSHQYKVQLLKIHPLDETLFVTINSPVSEQSIQVPITSPNVAQKCVNQPLQSMSSALLTVISNLGLIISTLIVLAATVWGTCISHLLICNFFYYQFVSLVHSRRLDARPCDVTYWHFVLIYIQFQYKIDLMMIV